MLYTPQAKLMHWGSATRGVTFDEAEHIAFLRRQVQTRNAAAAWSEQRLLPGAPARPVAAGRAVHAPGAAGRDDHEG